MGSVKVLYFARMADITKIASEQVELDPSLETVEDVLGVLLKKYDSDFAKLLDICMFAVDMEYVSRSHPLGPGQEMAIIPPVSGG
ncbi:molybdopterin converting factor small subunit [Absidia repens]|uniref:Molybdopterin converting factor small subunit n=1 Tax=Absidia repens TaxID=90262 RepID=A0A1X2HYM5_9FUNG|nr:molybdopterin converting factor small subunit [Absidia repens]